jgi:hypothetical protein
MTMSVRKSDGPSSFRNEKIISGCLPLWQPRIGDKVRIVRGLSSYEISLAGRVGEVVRSCGLGIFEVEFKDGQRGKLKSKLMERAEK